MILLSELISKRVISMAEAKDEGTVANILFNAKVQTVAYLKLFSDLDNDACVRYLDYKKVKNIGVDAVIINDESSITFEWNTKFSNQVLSPMNLECFNQDGKFLGFVKDIELEDGKVLFLIVSDARFKPEEILSISTNLVIINDTKKPIKLIKPAIKKTKIPVLSSTENPIVTLHNTEINEKKSEPIQENNINTATINAIKAASPSTNNTLEPTENKPVTRPPRVPPQGSVNPNQPDFNTTPYKFLLGKTLMRDISLDNGDLLILAKTLITAEIITIAKENGKLVQLALHAE